jgi:excisionase family DNA binding protein
MGRDHVGDYLSPQDIADDLDVSVETVYGWFSRALGPDRIKVGRHVRVPRTAYDRWLTQRTVRGRVA